MTQTISPISADDSLSPDIDALADEQWGPGRQFWLRVRSVAKGEGLDQYTPLRLASHLALIVVALGLLVVSQIDLPKWEVAQRSILAAPPPTPTAPPISRITSARGGMNLTSSGPMTRLAVPFTTIPDRPRLDLVNYVVQPGDTVFGIAKRFGLRPETIMWSNTTLEQNPDLLRVSDKLIILPVNGVYHEVKKGDTVEKIAKQYKVKPEAILGYALNKLADASQALTPGGRLVVPGGEKPFIARVVAVYSGPIPKGAARGTGAFGWPSSGHLTQGYWNGHRALDIGSWIGNPVVAADSGFIVYAGWDRTGYGNLIIVDHGNGYRTYYAHLSKILVRVGESVGKGQRIGSVGSTGHSTGPHLHFEIRVGNLLQNPGGFLR